jgi:hypothetical protein
VGSSQVLHEGARSTWNSGKAPAPHVSDFLGGQDLCLLYVLPDSDAQLVNSASEGGLLVHCDKADPRGVKLVSDVVIVLEELSLADIALLPEKDRNKILNQRARDAKKALLESTRATAKAAKEAAAEKEGKKGQKLGKSKVITPQLLLTETSTATPSPNPRKRDSSLAQLLVSRLQQLASPSLMDSAGGTLHVQEFFFSRSLLSTDAYYMDHEAFPKEWVDMKGFLKKVCIFSS